MTLSRLNPLIVCLVTLAGSAKGDQHKSGEESQVSAYIDRALQLPVLGLDDQCPVSTGVKDIVSADHQYIFGAGGFFFGSGPVYLALSWKPSDRAEAYFELDQRAMTSDGYRLKTPWIMHAGYRGEALIRGVQIGTDVTRNILFAEYTQSQSITANMILRADIVGTSVSSAQAQAVDAVWGFWPSHIVLSEPGCYAIQIDTERGSDIVVFEARDEE